MTSLYTQQKVWSIETHWRPVKFSEIQVGSKLLTNRNGSMVESQRNPFSGVIVHMEDINPGFTSPRYKNLSLKRDDGKNGGGAYNGWLFSVSENDCAGTWIRGVDWDE